MGNLVKAEFFRLSKSASYKVFLEAYFLFLILYTGNEISNSIAYPQYVPGYTGAEWLMRTPAWYLLVFAFFAANYVAGEFKNRTIAGPIMQGHSRGHIFGAKAVAYLAGLLPFMLLHSLTGLLMWTGKNGFGMELNAETVVYLLKMMVYMALIWIVFGCGYFLCAMVVKNRIGTVVVGFGMVYFLGVLAGNAEYIPYPLFRKILEFVFQFTIYYHIGELNGRHTYIHTTLWQAVIYEAIASALMLFLAWRAFKKCDLR